MVYNNKCCEKLIVSLRRQFADAYMSISPRK
ncbi:MAG: hypothetical protein JWQ02_1499 [Capsulimonas sp.]|jgi:hypothetical protein|nr:hypothetical protein [Capsulimonas sp.]